MITNTLLDWIRVYYLSPNESVVSYYFKRQLKRDTKRYVFTLQLDIVDKITHAAYTREILLGTSLRN